MARGNYCTVAGGNLNTAAGNYSFATGQRAMIATGHDGTLIFTDQTDAYFNSAAANEFAVRANRSVRFITNSTSATVMGLSKGEPNGTYQVLSITMDRKQLYGFFFGLITHELL